MLIIHGRHDRVVPLQNSQRLAEKLRRVRLEVMEGCGHAPQEEHPERFVALVKAFLER